MIPKMYVIVYIGLTEEWPVGAYDIRAEAQQYIDEQGIPDNYRIYEVPHY